MSLKVTVMASGVFLSVAISAFAQQIPALPEISDEMAAANPRLAQERARLVRERAALRNRREVHNQGCNAVEEGSAAESRCLDSQQKLGVAVRKHIDESKQYIKDFQVARELKSVEGESRDAAALDKEAASEKARKGFDTPGEDRGTLEMPKISSGVPSSLERFVPEAARKDPVVQQQLEWYAKLEQQQADRRQKIADIREQKKTSKDPLLDAKIASLEFEHASLENHKKTAKEATRKRVLDLGFQWNEAPPTAGGKK